MKIFTPLLNNHSKRRISFALILLTIGAFILASTLPSQVFAGPTPVTASPEAVSPTPADVLATAASLLGLGTRSGCKRPRSAPVGCTYCGCNQPIGECQNFCMCVSNTEMGDMGNPKTTLGHVTEEFQKHRVWMERMFIWDANAGDKPGLAAAMQLMTSQLTTTAMLQVQTIGTFFDAKHQLETQRLFQVLTARAHKDYHPSEALCEVGTLTKSLASSDQRSRLTTSAIATSAINRQLLSKDSIAYEGSASDQENRLIDFVKKYCNRSDNSGSNSNNLLLLCDKSLNRTDLQNRDINFTATIDSRETLDLDFVDATTINDDEAAILALSHNLLAHKVMPFISSNKFVVDVEDENGLTEKKVVYETANELYLDARSLVAKQSIGINSLAEITALKTKGDDASEPFLYAMVRKMGGDSLTLAEIQREVGDNPSYSAQMDFLTKRLYQNPEFYVNLTDKPANVVRIDIATQAATMMQKWDLYESYLRTEMIFAVMLETALMEEQKKLEQEVRALR